MIFVSVRVVRVQDLEVYNLGLLLVFYRAACNADAV